MLNRFFTISRRLSYVLVFLQLVVVYLIAIGVWPQSMVWLTFGMLVVFIVVAEPFESLLITILSIPLYLVLPNSQFDSFSAWRPLVALLFLVWFVKTLFQQREYWLKITSFRRLYREQNSEGAGMMHEVRNRLLSRFLPWDKYIVLFLILSFLSASFSRFPVHGLKQWLFLVNAYLLYVVVLNVVTTRERLLTVIKTTAGSLGLIVLLGYIQFSITLFSNQYYFWQYWAIFVSKAYYGLGLASVLAYSNSWFSYSGGQQSLRMFSVMPDSHSFGVICLFLLVFLTSFVVLKKSKTHSRWLWVGIILTALGLILSGTRGIWVGMFVPLVIAVFLAWRQYALKISMRFATICILVIALFILSPVFNRAVNFIRAGSISEDFLERAASIYDLNEQSNVGRIIIWKDSLSYAVTHPFGAGYGNFITSVVSDIPKDSSFEEVSAQKNLRYNLPQKFITAHSLYLNIAVELGLLGIIISVLFGLSYAKQTWKFIREHGNDQNIVSSFAITASLGLVWLLAYGVFDVTLFNDKVLLYSFVILALCGIIFRRYKSFGEHSSEQSKGIR